MWQERKKNAKIIVFRYHVPSEMNLQKFEAPRIGSKKEVLDLLPLANRDLSNCPVIRILPSVEKSNHCKYHHHMFLVSPFVAVPPPFTPS
jgi:hypothetical protein